MKAIKMLTGGMAASLFFLCATVSAQEMGAKIGFVNLTQAISNTEAAQTELSSMDTEFAGDQQRLQSLSGELQALQEKYTQDEAIMSDSEKRRMQADAEEKQVQLQLISERLQQNVQDRQQVFVDSMRPHLSQAIADVVSEGGYDLVLNASAVAFPNPAYDITSRVTAKLNQILENASN
ncbi:MAG: OmpH family outer membrane protein [Pseudohongiellaceae bacterium]